MASHTVPLPRLMAEPPSSEPRFVSMRQPMAAPVDMLPPEIWLMVLDHLEDLCFSWFVIRRVSPYLRQIAEAAFASHVLQNATVRFTGDYAWSVGSPHMPPRPGSPPASWKPSFLFKPTRFAPADTRVAIVLRLDERPADYEPEFTPPSVWRDRSIASPALTFRRNCCSCHTRVVNPADVARCDCLARLFCAQSQTCQSRLARESHFVRLDSQLRCVTLPSVSLDPVNDELSLDWRLLCQKYFYDELKSRRIASPWARFLSPGDNPGEVKLAKAGGEGLYKHLSFTGQELPENKQKQGWIFWDSPSLDYNGLLCDH